MLVIAQYMHDIEYIRKNPEGFEKAMKSRGIREFTAKEILEIDYEKRSIPSIDLSTCYANFSSCDLDYNGSSSYNSIQISEELY